METEESRNHPETALPLRDDSIRFPALMLVDPDQRLSWIRRLVPLGVILLLAGVAFMPWQQSVGGRGRVIAFDPLDRRVNVEARVAGVVRKSFLAEGRRVRAGEALIELEDNDPNFLANLARQRSDAHFCPPPPPARSARQTSGTLPTISMARYQSARPSPAAWRECS